MKYQKKFILVFALFWVIGLLGGYYLGVGSAILPTEYVEYNYYFTEKADSSVEPISRECDEDSKSNEDSVLSKTLKSLHLYSIPKKILKDLLSPSACNQKDTKADSVKKVA